mmetsp:Transcript_45623/g.115010  ORF Transcript_45623/g.115010 Transcript_45623/m.115010 type:complete len:234 (-) Transcript_45623:781-1482(-)
MRPAKAFEVARKSECLSSLSTILVLWGDNAVPGERKLSTSAACPGNCKAPPVDSNVLCAAAMFSRRMAGSMHAAKLWGVLHCEPFVCKSPIGADTSSASGVLRDGSVFDLSKTNDKCVLNRAMSAFKFSKPVLIDSHSYVNLFNSASVHSTRATRGEVSRTAFRISVSMLSTRAVRGASMSPESEWRDSGSRTTRCNSTSNVSTRVAATASCRHCSSSASTRGEKDNAMAFDV